MPTDRDLDALGGIVKDIRGFDPDGVSGSAVLLRLLRRAVNRPAPVGSDPTNAEVLAVIKAVDERMSLLEAIREALRRADEERKG